MNRSGMCLKGWQICSETSTKQTLKCGSCVFCQRMRIRVNWVNLRDFHVTHVKNVTSINLSIFMKPRYPMVSGISTFWASSASWRTSMWPYVTICDQYVVLFLSQRLWTAGLKAQRQTDLSCPGLSLTARLLGWCSSQLKETTWNNFVGLLMFAGN